ncbi:MAG: MGMT family protein [Saprospiraceae bacterium]|nr:MGMT family protein [Saprospiraceae bacterium]
MSSYFSDVFELTILIPPGRVSTYGIISDYLGLGSPRMVGWALNRSFDKNVPAHRVVNRKGELSGRNHFPDPEMMQKMLEAEGVTVENNKVKEFTKLLWYFD